MYGEITYDTFVSYSHRLDKPLVLRLQRQLQSLGKAWWQRRAIRVFRDESSLSASPALWAAIEKALKASRYFIICASPEAAASKWVDKEVRWWLDNKGRDRFLIVLTSGELQWDCSTVDFVWNEASPLPRACRGAFNEEPKWVDFRAYRAVEGGSRDADFLKLIADLSSAIRNVPKEDLLSEEVRQQRRARQIAFAAAGSLAALAGVAVLMANRAAIARADTQATARTAALSASNFVYRLFGGENTAAKTIDPKIKFQLLTDANSLLDKISAVGLPNDSHAQRARGAVQTELSQVFLANRTYNQATESAAEGVRQFKALLAKSENDAWIKNDLAVAYERLGRAQGEIGEHGQAFESYNNGLRVLNNIEVSKQNSLLLRTRTILLTRLGELYQEIGKPIDALSVLSEGQGLRERIAAGDQSTANFEKFAIDGLRVLGAGYLRAERSESAISILKETLDRYRALEFQVGSTLAIEENIAETYDLLSQCFERLGKNKQSRESTDAEFEIRQRVFAADKSDQNFVAYLKSVNNRAVTLLFRGSERNSVFQLTDPLAQLISERERQDVDFELEKRVLFAVRAVASIPIGADLAAEPAQMREILNQLDSFEPTKGQSDRWFSLRSRFAQYAMRRAVATSNYNEALVFAKGDVEFCKAHSSNKQEDLRRIARALGQLSWNALLTKSFDVALQAAEEAASTIEINSFSGMDFVKLNFAHALLFSGREAEAIAKYAAVTRSEVANDFSIMLKAGICHPIMRSYLQNDDAAALGEFEKSCPRSP